MSEVTVENVRDHPSDAVRAEFDVRLGGVLVRDVRLVDGRSGTFVGMPSRKNRETDAFYDVVVLSDALKARVLAAIEEAVGHAEPPPTVDVDDIAF